MMTGLAIACLAVAAFAGHAYFAKGQRWGSILAWIAGLGAIVLALNAEFIYVVLVAWGLVSAYVYIRSKKGEEWCDAAVPMTFLLMLGLSLGSIIYRTGGLQSRNEIKKYQRIRAAYAAAGSRILGEKIAEAAPGTRAIVVTFGTEDAHIEGLREGLGSKVEIVEVVDLTPTEPEEDLEMMNDPMMLEYGMAFTHARLKQLMSDYSFDVVISYTPGPISEKTGGMGSYWTGWRGPTLPKFAYAEVEPFGLSQRDFTSGRVIALLRQKVQEDEENPWLTSAPKDYKEAAAEVYDLVTKENVGEHEDLFSQ